MRCRRWWAVLVGGLAGGAALAQSPLEEMVHERGPGSYGCLTWIGRQLTATGRVAVKPGESPDQSTARAKEKATEQLSMVTALGRVNGTRSLGQLSTRDAQFDREVEAILARPEWSRPEFAAGGEVVIRADLPLFGGDQARPTIGRLVYARDDVWPRDVTPWSGPPAAVSGLLLDARERGAPGAFAPRVLDTAGRLVWTVECADRRLAEQAGAMEYRPDWAAACKDGRAGANPLIARVVAVQGADLVVSVADGDRIAPRPAAQAAAWCFAGLDLIRIITPVSPIQKACCVSTALPKTP